ncbi:hypothetical protein FNV43_RR06027 [Rhamnella rubrinervis]|uniref:Uncharacterized protein n=1 Tax=Rhamnella rubrinervis TaxID=2594499 RepID=A0A8K0MLD9_9ROSA|nr:hypothetical protein FNV43_RR06027 [Rhamnella rubrinervis]
MASVSFLAFGLLVLACNEVLISAILHNNNTDVEVETMIMEKEELLGLFEVLDALLDDSKWAQQHPLPCTETPWPGVQCEIGDQDPPLFHVTKIHIGPDILNPPCKSSARLSDSLFKLPYLKTLSIFNCFLESNFTLSPTLFDSSSFPPLEHLALGSNPSLSGLIPPGLAKVVSLKVLTLSQNKLEGRIPREIGGLVTLEQLDLSDNSLSGEVPLEIGGLENLTILDLSWNGLEGQVPCSLGQLELLQKIDLSSNSFMGRLPSEIGKLKNLILLDLSHNSINGPVPETLSGLENLEYLIVDHNPLNTEIPKFVGSLGKLQTMSLSACGLRGPILPFSWSSLKHLSALSLDNNSLTGTVPPSLGTLESLEHLNLSNNELSGELSLPEDFINRLGKRLDVRGNNGLCTSNHLQVPVCLNRKDKALSTGKHPDDQSERIKPADDDHEHHMNESSSESEAPFLKQKLIISMSVIITVCSFLSIFLLI